MKGIKIDPRSALLGGLLGAGCGTLLGYVLAKRILRAQFDVLLDKEVEAVKDHYDGHLRRLLTADKPKPTWAGVVQNALAQPIQLRPEGYGAGPDSRGRAVGTEDEGDELPGVPGDDAPAPVEQRDATKPYVISIQDLADPPNPGWQQLTITYYAEDKVLADDKEQPIRDIRGTVGSVELITFGGVSGDPHVKYVRNEKLEIDFEIVYDRRSYTDVVLGYGQPNRKRATANTD